MPVTEKDIVFIKEQLELATCERFLDIFIHNEISEELFRLLTFEDLRIILPDKLGPQKLIFAQIQKLLQPELEVLQRGHGPSQGQSGVDIGIDTGAGDGHVHAEDNSTLLLELAKYREEQEEAKAKTKAAILDRKSKLLFTTSYCDPNGKNQSGSPIKDGKLIWEFIEEKLIREGVNQVLTEISDVAERLSKIADEKFIPIRRLSKIVHNKIKIIEEENEKPAESTVQMIQVETPFLSHLLDVPFGTYIFKEDNEDSERRQPSATKLSQLSLTSVSAEFEI